jgi:hypothetical protein
MAGMAAKSISIENIGEKRGGGGVGSGGSINGMAWHRRMA